MVNHLDETFAALADPTRRAILARLWEGEASVTELAEPHAMSLPALTKHLSVLEAAGLVASEKRGRVRHCRLQARPLRDAAAWLAFYERFWTREIDNLDRFLKKTAAGRNSADRAAANKEPAWPTASRSPASSTRRRAASSTRGRRRR